jgi:exopolysaccharide biosynthesis polyprenyl glycosylphosphotransferase
MDMYLFCKRFFDVVVGFLLLLLFLPVMAVISISIKIDSPGPVLFRQKRVGKNGKVFTILKFRTMVVNAEQMGTRLNSFADDNRVTRVGRFLRRSSLDELPQLVNILIGDMSFVGPRPPVTYHPYRYEDYPTDAKRRFEVLPGVTGYAQVNGRNELSWEEKFKYDLYYVDNKSILLDLKILFLTIIKVLKMEGSYDVKRS